MNRFALVSLPILLLVACTPEEQAAIDSAMEDSSASMQGSSLPAEVETEQGATVADEDIASRPQGVYHDAPSSEFLEEVITDGHEKVLFFHAAWCPICKQADTYLREELLNGEFRGEALMSVYRVDFDTATQLRQRYGVTSQHTFVKLDGEGNVVAKLHGPSNDELYEFLTTFGA